MCLCFTDKWQQVNEFTQQNIHSSQDIFFNNNNNDTCPVSRPDRSCIMKTEEKDIPPTTLKTPTLLLLVSKPLAQPSLFPRWMTHSHLRTCLRIKCSALAPSAAQGGSFKEVCKAVLDHVCYPRGLLLLLLWARLRLGVIKCLYRSLIAKRLSLLTAQRQSWNNTISTFFNANNTETERKETAGMKKIFGALTYRSTVEECLAGAPSGLAEPGCEGQVETLRWMQADTLTSCLYSHLPATPFSP